MDSEFISCSEHHCVVTIDEKCVIKFVFSGVEICIGCISLCIGGISLCFSFYCIEICN